ncbi:tRNA (adenosine(37)-N6)-threonylcarbamoyltransferase complex dimerization subunit type 1 TsaB [Pedobacter sp. Du54]|uniref:tRNA (adenosine(37)-N6)-threonylcarbamoyltransferase complex dimerization subunit type 1 TsaB n=1 Tax=Pedobacter anseongensis TaxID=3133439 RepID=UPI0030A40B08
MPTILQLETATPVCSVALSINGKTVALKEETAQNIHASKLTLFINDVMEQAGIKFSDLDAIAVSKGPGSYTGLRIGVSTAKGLCFALDKPLIGINTLSMIAAGFLAEQPDYKGLICPMIDARRMEVFTAIFDYNLMEVEATNAKIIDDSSFLALLDTYEMAFIGNGAEKCSSTIQHKNAKFLTTNYNSASNMTLLANVAFTSKNFEDVAYFEPFYLKDFVFTVPKKKG